MHKAALISHILPENEKKTNRMICKYNEKEHRAFVLVSLVFLTNFVLVAPSKLADFKPEILQSEANARYKLINFNLAFELFDFPHVNKV